jgi:hypothetical protein
MGGPISAQYASLQVDGGQSGQLLPCGQLSEELLYDELLLTLDEELDNAILFDEWEEELKLEEEDDLLDEITLDGVDDTAELPPQIAPVTTGVSIAPLAFTCIPKTTVCPG